MATSAAQAAPSVVNVFTFITAMTVPIDTSADSAARYYLVSLRALFQNSGTLSSQELEVRVDGTQVWLRSQWANTGQIASDFFRVSLTPGVHSLQLRHRLRVASAGATGTVANGLVFVQPLNLV